MTVRKAAAIIIVLFCLAQSAFGQNVQQNENFNIDALEKSVKTFETKFLSTTDTFYYFLGSVRVPGGFAKIIKCKNREKEHEWQPLETSLKHMLNAIVSDDKKYKWEYKNGAVNLLPVSHEPALLKIQISDFQVENVTSAWDALDHLLQLSEVKNAMRDLNLKFGIAIVSGGASLHPKPFSVDCKDMTFRDVLNAIAKAQGRAIWQYIEVHCKERNEVIIRF